MVKRARAPLDRRALERPDALLTTGDVARLLRVHPKHVYRLLRRGLPGHRVGGEWRFVPPEVLAWSRRPADAPFEGPAPPTGTGLPPLLAANGDLAVEILLAQLRQHGSALGLVQADRGQGLELLRRGEVLLAGCHGDDVPRGEVGGSLVFVELVGREVGLATRAGWRRGGIASLARARLASRPPSAGVRAHLDRQLRRGGLDADAVHARAKILPSHEDVVCAIARREADVGLASAAWACRVGLRFEAFCSEAYGLLVRASHLGDPRVVRLCEVVQGAAYRQALAEVAGYETGRTGTISYEFSARGGGAGVRAPRA
jgi:excisionase family DNA binding protein